MTRILGQAPNGTWHVASSTYTTTMHTKCGQWMRVIAFSVPPETPWPPAGPTEAPTCTACWSLARLERLTPNPGKNPTK